MPRQILLLSGLLALGACAPGPEGATPWSLQASATSGAALVFAGPDGEVRIACRRNPDDIHMRVEGLSPHAGETVLKLQGEGVGLSLTVERTDGDAGGVQASAPRQPEMVEIVKGPMRAIHGDRTLSLTAPPDGMANSFAQACRG